jgi:hypothetical protein
MIFSIVLSETGHVAIETVFWSTYIFWLNLTKCSENQRQSQSYFTTGGLPPISSFWRQAPWGSRPAIFFELNPCGHSPYVKSSRQRGCVSRLRLLLALASAAILGSESRRTDENILLLQIRDSPKLECQFPVFIPPREQGGPVIPPGTGFTFRRLVQFPELRLKYSTPPPHGIPRNIHTYFLKYMLLQNCYSIHGDSKESAKVYMSRQEINTLVIYHTLTLFSRNWWELSLSLPF